jgi:hypothetical protein
MNLLFFVFIACILLVIILLGSSEVKKPIKEDYKDNGIESFDFKNYCQSNSITYDDDIFNDCNFKNNNIDMNSESINLSSNNSHTNGNDSNFSN